MKAEAISEILNGRNWVNLHGDESSWCEIDEPHIYCCVRPEAILRTDVMGMLLQINGRTHEVCMVDSVCPAEGEDWLLVYVHPLEPAVEPMPEEEWNDLYGDT